MTQEFVTLPREVVERALAAMSLALSDVDWRKGSPTQPVIHKAYNATRAALEQPQNHVPAAGNMAPAGWKLVPMEPTIRQMAAMGPAIRACYDMDGVSGNVVDVYQAMLAAAPQPPYGCDQQALDLCQTCGWKTLIPGDCCLNCARQQPQVEQEPVAWCALNADRSGIAYFDGKPIIMTGTAGNEHHPDPLYTQPQPQQDPLSTARIDELIEEGIFGGNPYELVRRLEEERGVFMTRPLKNERIRLIESSTHFHESRCWVIRFARAIEAAHNIK